MFIVLGCAFFLQAQQISFQLSKQPKPGEKIFLAGNINGWNPAAENYQFDADGRLQVKAKPGDRIAYKCTLGSWEKVEVSANGNGIANRELEVHGDTTIIISIGSWSHLFPQKAKQHTASKQVVVFDSAFQFPSLGYSKSIRVYLPPDYHQSNKKYAVLYMHDGQNIFDDYTSGYGEWHVDEAMDSLYKATGKSFIVVGMDHGNAKRINEYNPYDSTQYGQGVGELYLKDLVQKLKPAIDKAYRTETSAKYTWIAGSSMGGLISTYGVLLYPKTFGGAGIFSPAYWINTSIKKNAKAFKNPAKNQIEFFFYCGGKEGERMVPDMHEIAGILCTASKMNCSITVDVSAGHNETAWTQHFHTFLAFMQNAGAFN
ncbi:MAG TPA: alpha/beta hydrolase-fold protein [Phnomibacter sp.]|nr:alpha/beta hydrolase-fold protein [Phnomibacter sp.]